MTNTFTPFPSIENFHRIIGKRGLSTLTYKSKIKLHGTNAGIRVYNAPGESNGTVTAQSRNRDLSIEKDNFGFALFVSKEPGWAKLADCIVYGEWAGPGIFNNVAVGKIEQRAFFIFSIKTAFGWVTEPSEIAAFLEPTGKIEDVYVLPWHSEIELSFDLSNIEVLKSQAATINDTVNEVEAVDPYILATFNITGGGEGLVFYPNPYDSEYAFKAKGDKHRVAEQKAAVVLSAEVLSDIDGFVKSVCTEARFEQFALGLAREPANTGSFIKAVSEDIIKEHSNEFPVEWRKLNGYVARACKEWWLHVPTY